MNTDAHTEIEVKFAATPETEPPELAGAIEGVVSESSDIHFLSAVYFDTEDLRLTRNKITLRRRTGGKDAGWHLKLPKQGTHRMELQADLGPDAATDVPPPDLLGPVRSLVRDLPLAPIAQVDNERHETVLHDADGTAIAEFCDDHVTAWSLLPHGERTSWREWEVEVGSAYTDDAQQILEAATSAIVDKGAVAADSPSKLATALGDSIANAPTPPTVKKLKKGSPAAAVLQALAANRDRLVAMDPAVRRDDWDSVHQMRVATRELRSDMRTFDGIITNENYTHLGGELKHLAGVLGAARDAEVVGERLAALAPLVDAPTHTRITGSMSDAYRTAHSDAVAFLDSPRYFALLADLDNLLASPTVTSGKGGAARKILLQHLGSAYELLLNRHTKAIAEWSDTDLPLEQRERNIHDVRKAVKRLRYSAEAAGQATGLNTKKLYLACKNLQTVLGDFQDHVTTRDVVLRLAKDARAHGEDTFSYGVLYQHEQRASEDALIGYEDGFAAVRAAYKKLMKKK